MCVYCVFFYVCHIQHVGVFAVTGVTVMRVACCGKRTCTVSRFKRVERDRQMAATEDQSAGSQAAIVRAEGGEKRTV